MRKEASSLAAGGALDQSRFMTRIMKRTLDSDQLGKKGEKRFADLCVSAGLIPNEASWDRKGWDFVVDWRHDPTRQDYDNRPTLPSCLVQVKTQWEGSTAIRAPLLALEHIAKDLRPAFIYVVEVVDDHAYGDRAYLAHLHGDLLGLVLKSLRQARVAKKRPSQMEVRLPLKRWFAAVQPNGDALREALESAIGPSMAAYSEAKQQQLKSLGFEAGHMDLTVQFSTGDREEIADAFLGLRPIGIAGASAVETRFGIPIPIPEFIPGGGEMHILPKSFGRCTILIHDQVETRPFRFQGDMFAPPKQLLESGEIQTLIKTKLFDLRFRASGISPPGNAHLTVVLTTSGEKLRKAKVAASEWGNFYGFLAAAADHPVRIEMVTSKGPGPINGSLDLDQSDDSWAPSAKLCKIAERVFERAGWPGTKLSIEQIGEAWERLEVLDKIITNPSAVGPLAFTSSEFKGATDGAEYRGLFVDCISFGEISLAYALDSQMVAALKAGEVEWKSRELSLFQLRRIRSRQRDYDRFVEDARRALGNVNLMGIRNFEGA
jgi:hypothetical protein